MSKRTKKNINSEKLKIDCKQMSEEQYVCISSAFGCIRPRSAVYVCASACVWVSQSVISHEPVLSSL